MLLFRQPSYDYSDVSKEEMAALSRKWQAWWQGIEKQGQLARRGPLLSMEGKVLKPGGVVTDGPFVEIKEKLGSFIVVKAENLEEATTLAHGCPALEQGGSVEVRPLGNPWSKPSAG
ncbi:Uncharacterized conserved protein [Fodinibius sediminis]|uniref:Uncharacterized conserved protein n=2 Tax=Fodinibius sediminis TaxID=1214077 RepID=A0A521ELA1_9BACT|nr:Uncharacterized conserved protein [Fodinibius sediminis]